MADNNAAATRGDQKREFGSAVLDGKAGELGRAYKVALMADQVRLMGTDAQRARLTEIENWRVRALRTIDDKFTQHREQYQNNEVLRLQRARGADKLQHPAPMPGMVDAMDGPGVEREAWQNVLGRQQQRKLRVEDIRVDLIEGLMRDVWKERNVTREFGSVARELSPSREGQGRGGAGDGPGGPSRRGPERA